MNARSTRPSPPSPPSPPSADDPLPLVRRWLDEASRRGVRRNPNAMTLATVDAGARPSARVVLLKQLCTEHGYCVFYTHYGSRKSRDLAANDRAAGVLHWDALGRQLRLEGYVLKSPGAESDRYFASRPWRSQLNAWVSAQSEPLDRMQTLYDRLGEKARELGVADLAAGPRPGSAVPRPPFWGGYRLWLDAIELWTEGRDRFHQRTRYTRALRRSDADGPGFAAGRWRREQLQP